MKVVLAYKALADATSREPYLTALPVGLGIMCAVLQSEGYNAKVANLSNESWSKVERFLTAESADILALSVFTHNRTAAQKLAVMAKKVRPDCWVVCGGPHASHAYLDVLQWPGVDAVVVGEGEETMLELVRYRRASGTALIPLLDGMVTAGGVMGNERPPIRFLDTLPFAHRGWTGGFGVDPRQQAEFLITSRGCPASCAFCSSPGFWGRQLRFRTAESVVAEVQAVQDELGLLYISFRDDTFTADRRRVIEICQQIIAERLYILWNCQSRVTAVDEEVLSWLKRAGCECIQFGIESGSPRVLTELGKRITPAQIRAAVAAARRVGLQVSVYLIAGTPAGTAEDITATEGLLQDILPHDGQVAPLAYYPGTVLFEQAVAQGRIPADLFSRCSEKAVFVRNDPLVASEVKRLLTCLHQLQSRAAYRGADFRRHKQLLGYCHATNLQAGEYYLANGQVEAAQREYEDIINREPANPWGWLALGELALDQGNWTEAERCLGEVHRLVPRHLPVLLTLSEAAAAFGTQAVANDWLAKAEHLAPGDGTVQKTRQQMKRGKAGNQ